MPSLPRPQKFESRAPRGSQKPMALPRKSGLASASAITSSLDAASDDVAFGATGATRRRGAGEREGGDDLLHLDLRSGPGHTAAARGVAAARGQWQGVCEPRRDGEAPLWRPRVDGWALAATSAPSLLGLTSDIRGSPSGRWAKQHRGRRFCLPEARGAGLVAGAAGCGHDARAARPAALPQRGDTWLRIRQSRHRAAPRLRIRVSLSWGDDVYGFFAVRCVFDAAADDYNCLSWSKQRDALLVA